LVITKERINVVIAEEQFFPENGSDGRYLVEYEYEVGVGTNNDESTVTRIYPYDQGSGHHRNVKHTYDPRSRLASIDESIDSTVAAKLSYDYNDANVRTAVNRGLAPVDISTAFTYDKNWRVTRLQHDSEVTPASPTPLFDREFEYDAVGNRVWMKDHLEPTLSERYEHDALNRLIAFERGTMDVNHQIPAALQDAVLPGEKDWTLDRRGNWTQHVGTTGATSPTTTTESRTANGVNEITGMSESGKYSYDFEYDEVGNLVKIYDTLGDMNCNFLVNSNDIDPFVLAVLNPTQYQIDFPGCDLMRADINGDGYANSDDIDPFTAIILGGGQGLQPNYEYVYDEENRLIEVKILYNSATQQSYRYDALGRRIETVDHTGAQDDPLGRTGLSSFTTRHVYAGLETIEEYVDDASLGWTLVREFLWGGGFPEMVALIDRSAAGDDPNVGNPEVLYPLHDTLGSVIGLVRAGDGELVEKVSYDPYGQTYFERPEPDPNDPNLTIWMRTDSTGLNPWPTSAYGNPFLWTGQRHDAGVGLYHFKFRSYSPRLGRWIQRDPLMYVDGVSMYQYVSSDPLGWIDPLGLCPPKEQSPEDEFIEQNSTMKGRQEYRKKHGNQNLQTEEQKQKAKEEGDQKAKEIGDALVTAGKAGVAVGGTVVSGGAGAVLGTADAVIEGATAANEAAKSGEVSVSTVLAVGTAIIAAITHASFADDAAKAQKAGKNPVTDRATKNTVNKGANFASKGEARKVARDTLGKNYVKVGDNKWRSADGRWQYRAKPGDTAKNHIHLEKLNPETGEVLENWHFYYPERE
jgi:RHS repeat-associated protein